MKNPRSAYLILSLLAFSILLTPRPAVAASLTAETPQSTTPAPASVRSIRLPLSPSVDRHHVFIRLRINKHKALPFLLDTGLSTALIIDDWASEELGVKKSSEVTIVEPGHVKFFHCDVQDAEAVTSDAGQPFVQVGFKSALCGNTSILPSLQSGERCAGSVGMPFFEEGAFTFDFVSRSLIFYPDGTPPSSNQGSVILPLILPDATQSRYFVHLETNGQSCDYLLDTGAIRSNIIRSLLPEFLTAYQPVVTLLTISAGMSQTLNGNLFTALTDLVLVKDFRLATLEVPFDYFDVWANYQTDSALGMDLLMHFTMTIDVKNKTLTLIPNDTAPGGVEGFLHGAVGFSVRPVEGKWLVSRQVARE